MRHFLKLTVFLLLTGWLSCTCFAEIVHWEWKLSPKQDVSEANTRANGGRYKYLLDLGTIEKVENGIIYTSGWLYRNITWDTSDIPTGSGSFLNGHDSGYGFIDYYIWQTPVLGDKRTYSIKVSGQRIRRGTGGGGGSGDWEDWESSASGAFNPPIVELVYPTGTAIMKDVSSSVLSQAKALIEVQTGGTVSLENVDLVWTYSSGSNNKGTGAGYGESREATVTQPTGGSGISSVNFYVSDKGLDTFKIHVQYQSEGKKSSGIVLVKFTIEADLKDEPPEGSEYASGVDDTQIWVRLNDETINPTLTSIEKGYHFVYTPVLGKLNIPGNNQVKVSIKDKAGNENSPNPATWDFTITSP